TVSGPLARRLVSLSGVSLAVCGSVFACLHELLLLLAFRVEGAKRVEMWTALASVSYAELPFLLLVGSCLRWWRPCLSCSRTLGVSLLLCANVLLCFSPLSLSPLPRASVADLARLLSNSSASLTSFTSSPFAGRLPASPLSSSISDDAFFLPRAPTAISESPLPSSLWNYEFQSSPSAGFTLTSAAGLAISRDGTSLTSTLPPPSSFSLRSSPLTVSSVSSSSSPSSSQSSSLSSSPSAPVSSSSPPPSPVSSSPPPSPVSSSSTPSSPVSSSFSISPSSPFPSVSSPASSVSSLSSSSSVAMPEKSSSSSPDSLLDSGKSPRGAIVPPATLPSPEALTTDFVKAYDWQKNEKTKSRISSPETSEAAPGLKPSRKNGEKRRDGEASSHSQLATKKDSGTGPAEMHAAAMLFALGALFASLVSSLSLALAIHTGLSVLTACILRFFTQGVMGCLGIVYGVAWGHWVDREGLASAMPPSSPLAAAAACVGACIFGLLATVSFFKSASLPVLPLSSGIRGGCWAIVALLALGLHHAPLPRPVVLLLLLALTGSLLFGWSCMRMEFSIANTPAPDEAGESTPRIFRLPASDKAFATSLCEGLLPAKGAASERDRRGSAERSTRADGGRETGDWDRDESPGWYRRGRAEEHRESVGEQYCAHEDDSIGPLPARCDTCGEDLQVEALLERSRSRVPVGYSGEFGRFDVLGESVGCEAVESECRVCAHDDQ
ncbi:hypothetical protein TGARI_206540B, partial [Toxoplasma gondii ARI]